MQLKSGVRIASTLLVSGATLALGAGAAHASVSQPRAVSAQDKAFVVANGQANLAEIALGALGLLRAQDSATKNLATVTLRDHTALEVDLAKLAKADGIALPTAPNAMQLATAAQLKATSTAAFDLAYAQAEVSGHQLAIAAAKTETTAGTNAGVLAYAKGYIPIATMHLDMATAEVSALSATAPTAVSAGSGGQAATDTSAGRDWEFGVGGGLLLAVASGAALATRRRRTVASV